MTVSTTLLLTDVTGDSVFSLNRALSSGNSYDRYIQQDASVGQFFLLASSSSSQSQKARTVISFFLGPRPVSSLSTFSSTKKIVSCQYIFIYWQLTIFFFLFSKHSKHLLIKSPTFFRYRYEIKINICYPEHILSLQIGWYKYQCCSVFNIKQVFFFKLLLRRKWPLASGGNIYLVLKIPGFWSNSWKYFYNNKWKYKGNVLFVNFSNPKHRTKHPTSFTNTFLSITLSISHHWHHTNYTINRTTDRKNYFSHIITLWSLTNVASKCNIFSIMNNYFFTRLHYEHLPVLPETIMIIIVTFIIIIIIITKAA